MRIKKSDLLDYIIITLMFLQLVILGFFGLSASVNRIVAILLIIRIVLHFHPIPKYGVVLSALVLGLFFISSRIGKSSPAALTSNFLLIFYPLLYVFYTYYVCRYKEKLIKGILDKSFCLINGVMIINIVVLLIQIHFPYSIQATITINEIEYYEDTISGLFAYGSTHVVGLFCIFVILFNLAYRKKKSKGNQRKIFYYTVVIGLLNCYISLNNDNKALFFLFPVFIVLYLTLNNELMSYRKCTTAMVYVLVFTLLLVLAYSILPSFSSFIDNSIFGLTSNFLSNYSSGTSAVGSNERIAIIGYAMSLANTWRFGQGIATGQLGQPGLFGFRHFGQSDMGSFLLLLGIFFFVLIILWYTYFCISIIKGKKKKQLPKLFIVAFIVMLLILSLYTQCFSRTNIALCLILITLALYMEADGISDLKRDDRLQQG